jgi:hypothetical protein
MAELEGGKKSPKTPEKDVLTIIDSRAIEVGKKQE